MEPIQHGPVLDGTHHAAGHALLRALGAQEDRVIQELAGIARRRWEELRRHLDEHHGGSRYPADLVEHEDLRPTIPIRVDEPAGGIHYLIVAEPADPDELPRITAEEIAEAELARSYAIEEQERRAEMYADGLAAGLGHDAALQELDEEGR